MSGWSAVLLAPITIPVILFILFILLLHKLRVLKSTTDLTDEDVISYLESHLAGDGGPWDWDDFTSIPITDPYLDDTRAVASALNPNLDDYRRERLSELIADIKSRQSTTLTPT